MTRIYRSIYGGNSDTVRLRTSPLAAVQEVVLLKESGIADVLAVQSLALRSVGLAPEQVSAAAERLEKLQKQDGHKDYTDSAADASVDKKRDRDEDGEPHGDDGGDQSSDSDRSGKRKR
jgi:hypothetical protein